MRYVRSDSFKADYRRLSAQERELFRRSVVLFNTAAGRVASTGDVIGWPASLRVKSVKGTHGIFEMTWSYAGPDGRATWEWTRVTDVGTGELHPAIRWRRIGGHSIFVDP